MSAPTTLITGGAGFVGINLAEHLLERGEQVRIFDSLARSGSEHNIKWLRNRYGDRADFVHADVREPATLTSAMADVDYVVHLAAQVAVTSSLLDPRADFEANALGTLNVLEAARACTQPPSIIFTSTNKVYGALSDLALRVQGRRYLPENERIRQHGVSEERALDFHSPYGCSKGAAEQYVLDYARSFGLRTIVLRMSCIYGPHQHGNEDQGWVAHFARCALADRPVTVYGDGMQVRDLLFVEDLVEAFLRARERIAELSGTAFNIGGGAQNAASVLEVLERIEQLTGHRLHIEFDEWRLGDQRYYVSDITRFGAATGWQPRMRVEQGVAALCEWLTQSPAVVSPARQPAHRAAVYP